MLAVADINRINDQRLDFIYKAANIANNVSWETHKELSFFVGRNNYFEEDGYLTKCQSGEVSV